MDVLVVGAGGREHALAWKCAQSPLVEKVFVAPGNAGTALDRSIENVAIGADDIDALLNFARDSSIGLTVIGPEAPLVAGIVDRFNAAGLRCFGPSASAARLEGSKSFAKKFLDRHAIATAAYGVFDELDAATTAIKTFKAPLVIKADGLAAGKGVVIAQSHEQAISAARDMLVDGMYSGDAAGANTIVVEEFLEGEEASFICMVDGADVVPFASSQDHKARDDGDLGPNTGGMGAYSPAPVVDATVYRRVMSEVIEPTVQGLQSDGIDYTGFLYAGLMIDAQGQPRVLEFNCRFGDPETQPIMMRLQDDLVPALVSACDHQLKGVQLKWDARASLAVVMASGGYPQGYDKGHEIDGLTATQAGGAGMRHDHEHDHGSAEDVADVKVFHCGTSLDTGAGPERVVTSGGRVLCVTALGESVTEAQARAYQCAETITFKDAYYRRDIGYRAVAREQQSVAATD